MEIRILNGDVQQNMQHVQSQKHVTAAFNVAMAYEHHPNGFSKVAIRCKFANDQPTRVCTFCHERQSVHKHIAVSDGVYESVGSLGFYPYNQRLGDYLHGDCAYMSSITLYFEPCIDTCPARDKLKELCKKGTDAVPKTIFDECPRDSFGFAVRMFLLLKRGLWQECCSSERLEGDEAYSMSFTYCDTVRHKSIAVPRKGMQLEHMAYSLKIPEKNIDMALLLCFSYDCYKSAGCNNDHLKRVRWMHVEPANEAKTKIRSIDRFLRGGKYAAETYENYANFLAQRCDLLLTRRSVSLYIPGSVVLTLLVKHGLPLPMVVSVGAEVQMDALRSTER